MTYFCSVKKITMLGIIMITIAANKPPQFDVYIMLSLSAYIPSEMVRKLCLDANTNASMYSFHMATKLNTETQIMPGCAIGSIIWKNTRNSPHPSMIADSSSALGIVLKNPVKTNRLNGNHITE